LAHLLLPSAPHPSQHSVIRDIQEGLKYPPYAPLHHPHPHPAPLHPRRLAALSLHSLRLTECLATRC
ncbi:hypothetical protein O3P69_013452, partial [Scylla paramamosain]